ncbi:endonuclease Q family protein [Paenibacillus tarimensis]|uniref:endonuclease Q family protein n=1 Tax=Paenibacillus tarimensis TaxID=416012 RepID=UPI001F1A9475|nr:endonuclease Q family protein [Paenibacillus tarimensis]MCF2942466.1 endonuclease Q family protein [Paenibacillus tarimensis]
MTGQQGGQQLQTVYADMHIHIGSTDHGEPVKISASRSLTFRNIAHEAAVRKGIRLLGVIDTHSPGVQRDIAGLLETGEMSEVEGGGIGYRDTTLLLGSEIEVKEPGRGPAHYLVFMPDFDRMRAWTEWMSAYMRNVMLSSQRIYVTGRELQDQALARGGLFIPAHIFTPHKSLYGSCTDSIAEVLDPAAVSAVELGLSADTEMAGYVAELDGYPFLTNSDAHSLSKIGREYNELLLGQPSFADFQMALEGKEGRRIAANYGLNPRLGKYHKTYCLNCESALGPDEPDRQPERCSLCGSTKLVNGVMDRIQELGRLMNREELPEQSGRPPYRYQIPLEFVPGVGPKLLDRLLKRFGTEMDVLHSAGKEELADEAGAQTADLIIAAREGRLNLEAGGGGKYGRVRK